MLNGVCYNGFQCESHFWPEALFDADCFGALPALRLTKMSKEFEGLTNLHIEFAEVRQSEPIQIK